MGLRVYVVIDNEEVGPSTKRNSNRGLPKSTNWPYEINSEVTIYEY